MRIRLKVNPRTKQVSQALDPQLKKRNSRQMTKKNAVGDQISLFASLRRKRKRTSHNSRRHCQKIQKPQAKRPDNLNVNMTRAKQQWGAEMERLNEKYNLDCFSDSELDSESDGGEQYHYEHGYKTLI